MLVPDYSNRDYWKAIILYGLNNATYKIALGKTLLELSGRGTTHVGWNVLSEEFLKQYKNRLDNAVMPQQTNPSRQTVMERIVNQLNHGNLNWNDAAIVAVHVGLLLLPRSATSSLSARPQRMTASGIAVLKRFVKN